MLHAWKFTELKKGILTLSPTGGGGEGEAGDLESPPPKKII